MKITIKYTPVIFLFSSFIITFFTFLSVILAQTIIENPEKPLSKNAGRILELKKVFRITDESGEFYFKRPGNLKISDDGYLFLADEDQLLKFSTGGEFLKNLFKKGKGPGEISGYFEYYIDHDKIYVYDYQARKIIVIDLEGRLVGEHSFRSESFRDYLGFFENWLLFTKFEFPPMKERKNQLQNIPNTLVMVSKDGKRKKDGHPFPVKYFLAQGGMMSWDPFLGIVSDDGRKLFVCHTREYLIKVLDLEKGEILHAFRRRYPRVKYEIRGEFEKRFQKKFHPPDKKYKVDIRGFLIHKGSLWVKTSIEDEERGDLCDVFNTKGQYIDNFYVKINGSFIAVSGDFVFALERDEDENLQIVKYKIVE